MEVTLNIIYVILSLLGLFGAFVIFVAKTSSKTTDKYNMLQASDTSLAQRLTSIESELKNEDGLRRKIDERLDDRLSSLDRRVQSVESKVVGVEVKIDAIKESITDLKKLMMGKGSSNS